MTSVLPVHIKNTPDLARYLGVENVCLIRDDQLPDGGGKKRRSLIPILESIRPGQAIHVLSYEGSHTAYTLARLLPDHSIILYGKSYPGGRYRDYMSAQLARYSNVKVIRGSLPFLMATFWKQKRVRSNDCFLSFGGALPQDREYIGAALSVRKSLGDYFHHIVPVASGNLLSALRTQFSHVTGVLTQPWYVRAWIRLHYSDLAANSASIEEREHMVKDIAVKTGLAFDPVFMGSVLAHVINNVPRYRWLCLWVTSPTLAADFIDTL